MTSEPNPSVPVPAPQVRRILAAAIDTAIGGGLVWLLRGRASPRWKAGPQPAGNGWIRMLGPAGELAREQLGSPGQRLLGLRTVDRRTGGRVALWRTLLLLAVGVAGQAIIRRSAPCPDPELELDRARFGRDLRAVHERHGDDPAARDAEMRRLFEQYPEPINVNLARSVGPTLAVGLLSSLLRRRLAPTSEVLVRGRRSHSP